MFTKAEGNSGFCRHLTGLRWPLIKIAYHSIIFINIEYKTDNGETQLSGRGVSLPPVSPRGSETHPMFSVIRLNMHLAQIQMKPNVGRKETWWGQRPGALQRIRGSQESRVTSGVFLRPGALGTQAILAPSGLCESRGFPIGCRRVHLVRTEQSAGTWPSQGPEVSLLATAHCRVAACMVPSDSSTSGIVIFEYEAQITNAPSSDQWHPGTLLNVV